MALVPAANGILLPYQQRWVDDPAPLKIWLASRQIGKSFAIAAEAVRLAREFDVDCLILSSSHRQSREVMRKVARHLLGQKLIGGRAGRTLAESREEATLPGGARIISLPASPDTVRGFSGNVFLDEFAFHQDSRAIWRAMYPTITRGHRVRITSTPNGMLNMFHDVWADETNGFSRYRTTIHDAVAEGFEVDVDRLRRGIGRDPDAWAQEYECAFIDEATAYITYELISACEDEGASMEMATTHNPPRSPLNLRGDGGVTARNNAIARPARVGATRLAHENAVTKRFQRDIYIGVDIGRHRDLTVIWVLEQVGDVLWTRAVRVLRNAPFSAQRDVLYGLLDGSSSGGDAKGARVPLVRRCCIDASGIGMQLAEEARERFGPRVEPVVFTATVKEDLAVTLRRRFEDRLVRIPSDPEIRDDIHSVQKSTTLAGNVRFDAARTEQHGHADRFWALALAAHAAGGASASIAYETVAGPHVRWHDGAGGLRFKGGGCW